MAKAKKDEVIDPVIEDLPAVELIAHKANKKFRGSVNNRKIEAEAGQVIYVTEFEGQVLKHHLEKV